MKYLITVFIVLLPVFCKAQGGLWCLCNQERKHYEKTLTSNSYKIDSIAKEGRRYSDSVAADASYFVRIKGKNGWGVVNKYGMQVVPFQYDHLSKYLEDGYFYASYKGKGGLIDTANNVIILFGQFEISAPESYSFVPFLMCTTVLLW